MFKVPSSDQDELLKLCYDRNSLIESIKNITEVLKEKDSVMLKLLFNVLNLTYEQQVLIELLNEENEYLLKDSESYRSFSQKSWAKYRWLVNKVKERGIDICEF
jgi:hypothetical protein